MIILISLEEKDKTGSSPLLCKALRSPTFFSQYVLLLLLYNKMNSIQDRQALLKAKYCPRVAAASRTQKNTPKTM